MSKSLFKPAGYVKNKVSLTIDQALYAFAMGGKWDKEAKGELNSNYINSKYATHIMELKLTDWKEKHTGSNLPLEATKAYGLFSYLYKPSSSRVEILDLSECPLNISILQNMLDAMEICFSQRRRKNEPGPRLGKIIFNEAHMDADSLKIMEETAKKFAIKVDIIKVNKQFTP